MGHFVIPVTENAITYSNCKTPKYWVKLGISNNYARVNRIIKNA